MSSLYPETNWAQGASGGNDIYDTSPAGLGLSPSYLASASASASSASGSVGTHANRPATASAGATYWETDTGGLFLFDGTTWQPIPIYPWLIDINVYPTAISQTNWDSINTANTGSIDGFTKLSTGAQNAEINWDVVLAAGTWTAELLHSRDVNGGIYSVQFDGVEKGTIDGYSNPLTVNVRTSVTGIAVPATAKIRLKLKMATKNASSSAYAGSLHAVQLRRTA